MTASQANRIRLQAQLAEVRKVVETTSARAQDREVIVGNLDSMAARLAEAEAEALALRNRLEAAPVAAPVVTPAVSPKPHRLGVELGIAVAVLLPRIDFVRNSLRFIAVELPERDLLWKALAALDRQERGLPPAWKSLSGHPGWWERHFSTGQDNQGRIYARAAGTPSRWQVLVSHKQYQLKGGGPVLSFDHAGTPFPVQKTELRERRATTREYHAFLAPERSSARKRSLTY